MAAASGTSLPAASPSETRVATDSELENFQEASPAPQRHASIVEESPLNKRAFAHSKREHIRRFMDELESANDDPNWRQCVESPLEVWKQRDPDTGLYRLRMRGRIPSSLRAGKQNDWCFVGVRAAFFV
jgi:hypothetical protein